MNSLTISLGAPLGFSPLFGRGKKGGILKGAPSLFVCHSVGAFRLSRRFCEGTKSGLGRFCESVVC